MGEGAHFCKVFKSRRFIFSDYIKYSLIGTYVYCEFQETIWTPNHLSVRNEWHHRQGEKLVTTFQ